jgi:cohesin domain-containing protein
MNRSATACAMAVLVVLATACGGGGGSNGGGGGAPPGGLVAGFQAAQASPGANSVAMSQGSKSGDVVTVAVNVTDTNDVYGASFDVLFSSSSVEYVGKSPGVLLEQGSNTPIYQVTVDPLDSGHLVVVATRTGNVQGVDVSGTLNLMNLTFRVKQAGSFPLTYANPSLYDAQLSPQPIAGLSWYAGEVTGI